jgi:hypothetical protein
MNLALNARRRAAGFGFGPNDIFDDWGSVGTSGGASGGASSGSSDDGSDGPPWWTTSVPLFSVIGKTVASIFGNEYQQQPAPVYRPVTQQYAAQAGYHYDSSGRLVADSVNNITSFIATNPLLVGAGILGVILLFRQPPGRR